MAEGWWRWTWEHWVSAAETHGSSPSCSVATRSKSSKFPGQQRDGTWDTGCGTQALAIKANPYMSPHLFCSLSHESKSYQPYLFIKLIYKKVPFLQMGRDKSSHGWNIVLGPAVTELTVFWRPFIFYRLWSQGPGCCTSGQQQLGSRSMFSLSKVWSVGLKEIP